MTGVVKKKKVSPIQKSVTSSLKADLRVTGIMLFRHPDYTQSTQGTRWRDTLLHRVNNFSKDSDQDSRVQYPRL